MDESKYRLMGAKEIKDGISFNLAIDTDVGYIYIIGFRVWRGLLMPPATRAGAKYYPSIYTGRDFAEFVYQQLIDLGWDTKYRLTLKDKELCTSPLIMDMQTYALHYEKP